MTAIADGVDYVSAPQDYAALFEMYWPFTVNFVAKLGIDDNNKEDVASEILMRFMERGSLERFDPGLNFEYRGRVCPARFKHYLSRSIDLYVRGQRDKIGKQKRRELQIFDNVANQRHGDNSVDTNTGGVQHSWGDQMGDAHPDHADGILDTMTEESEATTVRSMLAKVAPRNAHDRCNLVELYDAVRAQVLAFGEYDISILKDKFSVSSTAMHSWMWWLRANLATIYGVPVPAKRPRRTKPKTQQP